MTLHDHIYSNFNISISFKPSITFAGSTGNLGSVRGRSLKAGRIRRLWRQQCPVLSSFFWQHLTDLYLLHALTDFNQTWSQEPLAHGIYVIWLEWGQRSRRGHRGQKCQKLKNASHPTDYNVWTCDSCILMSLTPSTKVMGIEIQQGSFEVTQGQKVKIHKKSVIPPYDTARPWN